MWRNPTKSGGESFLSVDLAKNLELGTTPNASHQSRRRVLSNNLRSDCCPEAMMYLLIVLCSLLLLRVHEVNCTVATDPVQGTSTFSIIYDFVNNNTPDNSKTIELDAPAGNPNEAARLTYTVNYRIAPSVPGAALTNELSFHIGTSTSDVVLASEPAPITGAAATSDVVAGVISGSALVFLGSDLVIDVTTAVDSNANAPEGSFTGFVTYTMEVVEGSKGTVLLSMPC